MARGAGAARHRLAQAVPRDRTLADRRLHPPLRPESRRDQAQALLHRRIGRPRRGTPARRRAPRRSRVADAYAEPDEVPERHPRPAEGSRAAIPAAGRRLSCGGREGAGHLAQAARGDRELRLERGGDHAPQQPLAQPARARQAHAREQRRQRRVARQRSQHPGGDRELAGPGLHARLQPAQRAREPDLVRREVRAVRQLAEEPRRAMRRQRVLERRGDVVAVLVRDPVRGGQLVGALRVPQ